MKNLFLFSFHEFVMCRFDQAGRGRMMGGVSEADKCHVCTYAYAFTYQDGTWVTTDQACRMLVRRDRSSCSASEAESKVDGCQGQLVIQRCSWL